MVSVQLVRLASVKTAVRRTSSGTSSGSESSAARISRRSSFASSIRGMCVSPDLQCVLCATEGLEGVYLLAVDNLGEEQEARPTPTA
ncbi:unnamed protein product, partial [Ectocarpus sp. 8 AP-2014]